MAKVFMYSTWLTVLIVCGSAAIDSGVASITRHMLAIEQITK